MQLSKEVPNSGLKGALENFTNDFRAAISVALVALPLGLGIAFASDVPPIAGITSAIIGGLITTFLRSGKISINGPAAGLIIVVAGGMQILGSFEYVLAAFIFSGLIQFLLGIFKFGKIANYLPQSVIQGILAAIGLIIIAKQLHVALGEENSSGSAIETFVMLPESIDELNLLITIISIFCAAFLYFYPKTENKIIRSLPSALWVLIIAIPLTILFEGIDGSTELFGKALEIPNNLKIDIPENLSESFFFPDFTKIGTIQFWILVISITIIGTIESLVSVKAVDKLDEYKRKTNIDRDLWAVGLSTMISGAIGGLPVITVIIRSSVNINHNAKTKYSNFYHAIILLVLVLLIPEIIREVPKAALAVILIFTGFRLASPRVFKSCYRKGWEQLVIFCSTMIFTLFQNLLFGLFAGILTTLLVHYGRTALHYKLFLYHLFNPLIESKKEKDEKIHISIKGVLNFLNLYLLESELSKFDKNKDHLILDFALVKLVDNSVLDYLIEYRENYSNGENSLEIIGLDNHITSSDHPSSLHVFRKPQRYYFTSRQLELDKFSQDNSFDYFPDIRWENPKLKRFRLFSHHYIEYTYNNIRGDFQNGVNFRFYDVAYNSGGLVASDLQKISLIKLKFNFEFCTFCVHKENLVDTISDWIGIKDLRSKNLNSIFKNYTVEYENIIELDKFFNDELTSYILKNPLNIETYGNEMIIYTKMRLLSSEEMISLFENAKDISNIILNSKKN